MWLVLFVIELFIKLFFDRVENNVLNYWIIWVRMIVEILKLIMVFFFSLYVEYEFKKFNWEMIKVMLEKFVSVDKINFLGNSWIVFSWM